MEDASNFETILKTYEAIESAISAGSMLDEIFNTAEDSTIREIILCDFAHYLSREILETLDQKQWDIISGDKGIIMIDTDEDNYCPLPYSFIWRHASKLNWNLLCCYYLLPENILRDFKHKVDWMNVRINHLSNEFISEHAHLLDWHKISSEELNEDFIEFFQDRVNWSLISENQELSEDFIERFAHRIDFLALLESEYAPSPSFIAELLTKAYQA